MPVFILIAFIVYFGAFNYAAVSAKTSSKSTTISASIDIINNMKQTITSFKQMENKDMGIWGKELLKKSLKPGESIKLQLTWSSTNAKVDLLVNNSGVIEDLDFKGITSVKGGSIGLYNDSSFYYGFVYNKGVVSGLPKGKDTTTIKFILKNNSDYPITTMRLSPAGKNQWGSNLIPIPIKVGAKMELPITINKANMVWDIKGTITDNLSEFTCKKLDFSKLKFDKECDIIFRTEWPSLTAKVTNFIVKTPHPKQSGNKIMFFDTDKDGILSKDEVEEQIEEAKPDRNKGLEATFSENIKSIDKLAFSYGGFIKVTFPPTISTIGEDAFSSQRSLSDVVFSEGLEKIDKAAFFGTAIKKISLPASLKTIGEAAFSGCNTLAEINLQEGVTSIGRAAFGATAISDIILPESLTVLQESVFSGCKKLTSINIPEGIKNIKESTFYECSSLKDVQLNSVTNISKFAFGYCNSLTNVEMPQVVSIGESAFSNCEKLNKIQLPESFKTFGEAAFEGCKKLELSIDTANINFTVEDGILYTKNLSELYLYPISITTKSFVIPSTVTTIKNNAFY